MRYLARLVDQPGVAIHVLDLAGSSDHPDRGDAGELLDPSAFRAYRGRLQTLRAAQQDAEERGDAEGAERARDEMESIASELSRASGPGGRARRGESAVDRARSAVQRRIKDAIGRIGEQDAALGSWLQRAVQTGNYCVFRPDP
jgi:non-specific serine/threonine protein kinase